MAIRPWTIFKPILILAAVVGIPAGFYMLSQLGPKPLDEIDLDAESESSDAVVALISESEELETQFRDILILSQPTEADLELLERSIDLIDEAQAVSPGFLNGQSERREELLQLFDDGMGRLLYAKIEQDELDAEKAKKTGDLKSAQRFLRRAYATQLKLNGDHSRSSFVDVGRALHLAREITFIESEPIYQESLRLEGLAEDAYREKNLKEARRLLRQAIQTQERLNQEFRNTQRASVVRMAELKAREVTFRSAQAYLEKEELVAQAEGFAEREDWAAAAGAFDEARRIQRDINTNFPTSGYSSNEEVVRLEVRRQTVLSMELFLRIAQRSEQLTELLRKRRTSEAQELVSLINRDLSDLRSRYSRSQHDTERLEIMVAYLNVQRSQFGEIQDRVYAMLLPLPGREDLLLSSTEIPQDLYSMVMGSNPSINIGSKRPVNSLRYEEAETFCQRLSWILGMKVRLPTREEFRLAVGSLRFVKLEEIAVGSNDDSEAAQMRDVGSLDANRYGFYDLLGNASEWVSQDSENALSENAWLVGGSARDPYSKLVQMPADDISGSERDAYIGFRVLAEQ